MRCLFSGRLLLLSVLLGLVLGCSSPPEPFRVGTDIWIGYEPLYLAQTLGHYDQMPIRMVAMHNATEVGRALRAGALEVAALTLDEALSIVQDGFDLKVILVMDISNGADVLMAPPEIRNLADLRGKRVGVDSGAVGAVMLHGVLEAARLQLTDIEPVHLTVDQHERAYKEVRVDAVVTFEPVRTQLLTIGAHVLFDSSWIPGRIVDVLVTTKAVADRHGATLKRLIAGHFAALAYLRANPLEAARKMRARQGIAPGQIVESYQGLEIPDQRENRRLLGGSAPALAEPAAELAQLMLDQRMLSKPVSVDGMFDDCWLPEP